MENDSFTDLLLTMGLCIAVGLLFYGMGERNGHEDAMKANGWTQVERNVYTRDEITVKLNGDSYTNVTLTPGASNVWFD